MPMTDRKTLQLRDPSDAAPPVKKKGRGWEISESRLDALHERAREMRRHSSDAHRALAARFGEEDFGKFAFKRHAVIGSAIVDFGSHPLGLAIALDEGDDPLATRRDASLAAIGIDLLRLPAAEVLSDMDGTMRTIFAAMNARYAEKQAGRRAHQQRHGAPRRAPPSDRTRHASHR